MLVRDAWGVRMQDPVARMLSAHRMTHAARCRGVREPCAFPTFAEAVNATLSRRHGDDCLFQTPVCSPSLARWKHAAPKLSCSADQTFLLQIVRLCTATHARRGLPWSRQAPRRARVYVVCA